MRIDAYLTPFYPETETMYEDALVIMIDVLRASTTVCAALYNGAKELIPCDSAEKAVQIFSGLSKEIRFLGGERGGMKPSGFDAGNSPDEYSEEAVKGRTVVIATTNGTKIFQKAKQAKLRLIGAFVNINAVCFAIDEYMKSESIKNKNVFLICAGNSGTLSYEDALCAGAYINYILRNFEGEEMTDSAHVCKNLYNLHSRDLKDFISTRQHAQVLKSLGFEHDIETALTFDAYPIAPVMTGQGIKIFDKSMVL